MRGFYSGISIVSAIALLGASLSAAEPIDEAFTYQGRLTISGSPAVGDYNFKFSLFDAETNGTMLGSEQEFTQMTLAPDDGGFFTVDLDFPAAAFEDGEKRWLEVWYRETAASTYIELEGRQELTAVPFASYSVKAGESAVAGESASAVEWSGTAVGNAEEARSQLGLGALATHGTGTTALTNYVRTNGSTTISGNQSITGTLSSGAINTGSINSTGSMNSFSGYTEFYDELYVQSGVYSGSYLYGNSVQSGSGGITSSGGISAGGGTPSSGEVRATTFRSNSTSYHVTPGNSTTSANLLGPVYASRYYTTGGGTTYYLNPNSGSSSNLAANLNGRIVATGTATASGFATTGQSPTAGRFVGNYFQGTSSTYWLRPNPGSDTGNGGQLRGRIGINVTNPERPLHVRSQGNDPDDNWALRLQTRATNAQQEPIIPQVKWDIGVQDSGMLRFQEDGADTFQLGLSWDGVNENVYMFLDKAWLYFTRPAETAPSSPPSSFGGGGIIYLDSNERLRAADSYANLTVISSHAHPREIDPAARHTSFEDPDVALPWSFTHKNTVVGIEASVDMAKLVAWAEAKMQAELGEEEGRLVHTRELDPDERVSVEDWELQSMVARIERAIQEDPWVEVPLEGGNQIPAEAWEEVEVFEKEEQTRTDLQKVLDTETMTVVEEEVEVTEAVRVATGRFERQLRDGYTFREGKLYRQRTVEDFSAADFVNADDLPRGATRDPEGRVVVRDLPAWITDRAPADTDGSAKELSHLSNEELLHAARALLAEIRSRGETAAVEDSQAEDAGEESAQQNKRDSQKKWMTALVEDDPGAIR